MNIRDAQVVVGAGRLSRKVISLPLGTLLFTLLDVVQPETDNQQYLNVDCAVLQFEVAKGIAKSTRGLALRTEEINVLGIGTLRLDTGEIDLRLKTAQRKGLGISILGIADKLLRLTGTLRQPEVKIDPVGALTHGGAAWATGGLSLFYDALVQRLTAFNNPCETVLKSNIE